MGLEIAKQAQLRYENLDQEQYTLSLLREGLRLGLIDAKAVCAVQEQTLAVLKELIMRYTKGESTSVRTETAERILNSIYYAIDAYMRGLSNPEACMEMLKSGDIRAVYKKGVELVTACVAETKALYGKIMKNRLEVPLISYNTSIEAIPGFFEKYNVVFGAQETTVDMDYPLAAGEIKARGIFFIRRYLENLELENQFCSFFGKEDLEKILAGYGRLSHIDYREPLVNIFELLATNSIFSVLSGNAAGLAVSETQIEMLQEVLANQRLQNPREEIKLLVAAAVERLIKVLNIEQSRLAAYIRQYETIFVQRLLNAVENNGLRGMIIIEDGEEPCSSIVFEGEGRMNDAAFRLIVRRIMDCADAAGKADIISTGVHSLEDYIDILEADCLFGDEFAAVFGVLGDMELAVLGRMVFDEELRNGRLALEAAVTGMREREWENRYIVFVQGLGGDRKKSLENCINEVAR